ncbi:MAG: hypothetical protein WBC04_23520 [Candidatus Acidiferrales bacterium]
MKTFPHAFLLGQDFLFESDGRRHSTRVALSPEPFWSRSPLKGNGSAAGLTVRPLVRGTRTNRPEFAREENQRRSDHAGAAQQPETIEKAKKCRLLVDHLRQLRFRVQRRVRGREAVRHKISRQRAECFLIELLEWSGVSNQNRLVILRSSRKNACNERDTNASPLVPEQIGKTRSFVVFILWQEGIGQLAHRHKQRGNPKPLDGPGKSDMLVVGT